MSASVASMESGVYSSSISSAYGTGGTTNVPTVHPSVTPSNYHMNINNIIIITIFCMVCLLLLVACFYAFCFNCMLRCSPKDNGTNSGCSIEREDATFRRTSSTTSLGNVI